MTYIRFNTLQELRKVRLGKPTKISADSLLFLVADDYLRIYRAAERRAKVIRRARRMGNLVIMPKRSVPLFGSWG